MRTYLLTVCLLVVSTILVAGTVSGELRKWHRVTVSFDGPDTNETAATNPFTDYRLNVTFANGGTTYVVPGYYAADGNAGETSATAGSTWRVHFVPDKTGTWDYSVSFRTGSDVAVSDSATAGSSAGYCDGETGSLNVSATNKTGRDHRGKGRLEYVGERYLRFAETGEYFVKGGADAPENFLAYDDFDNTPDNGGRRKSWSAHVSDWNTGDPTWKSGKGKGIIGALNYLAAKGCNVFSFLPMNISGDDKNVFPYVSDGSGDRTRFDCSKLDQWEIVFAHADKLGLYLHFKTQETENDQLLDGGALGIQRKIYYRELIARFGHHLALNWNLGEENTNTEQQRKDFARYFYDHDPYRHNVVLHTYPGQQESVYRPLLGNSSKLTGVSIQIGWSSVHAETLQWVQESSAAGKPWVVANDEQGGANTGVKPDADDYWHDGIRAQTLWGNLMAGGAGVEYYFGYSYAHSDLTCEDFRSRDHMWDMTRYALEFFNTYLPFESMWPDDSLTDTSGDFCLAQAGQVYAIYLPSGGTADLDLGGLSATFTVKWYSPRTGGALQTGSVPVITGPGQQSIGQAPSDTGKDWAVLVELSGSVPTYALTVDQGTGDGSYPEGSVVTITANAPQAGKMFDAWTGDTSHVADVHSPSTTVTMPGHAITVTATYKAAAAQELVSLTLINADTDQPIAGFDPLSQGATLNLAALPTTNLNIRANTNPATVGSVRFGLDGNANYQTESTAPYALAGDSSGDYSAWTPSLGSHTVTATPYTASGGGGTAGVALTIGFDVIDDAGGNTPPTVNAGGDQSITLPDNDVDLNGTVFDPDDAPATAWSKQSGSGNVTFGDASLVDTSAAFTVAGVYVLRLTADDGTTSPVSDTVSITVNADPGNDADGDGMDDTWETAEFGDLSHTGAEDSDNDGLDDLDEFLAGTDPWNSDSDDDGLLDGDDPQPLVPVPGGGDGDEDGTKGGCAAGGGSSSILLVLVAILVFGPRRARSCRTTSPGIGC